MSKCSFDISPNGPYYEVIRSAIWNTPLDTSSWPDDIDWNPILQNYLEQSVLPLVSDVLYHLPEKYRLTKEQEKFTFETTLTTIKEHCRTRDIYNNIFKLLVQNGLTPILLKGEALAARFHNPNLRACGDIDLYLKPEECDKAVVLLCNAGAANKGDSGQHYELIYDNTIIELHHELGEIDGFRGIRGMQRKTESLLISDIMPVHPEKLSLGDISIPCFLLKPQKEALFLFLHLSKHLIGSGVGLRQFIDQAVLFKNIEVEYSNELFLTQVKDLQYESVWNMVASVLVQYLGLPKQYCPDYKTVKQKDLKYLIKYLTEVGNFANYDVRQRSIHEVGIISFLLTFLRKSRLNIRFFPKRFCISIIEHF